MNLKNSSLFISLILVIQFWAISIPFGTSGSGRMIWKYELPQSEYFFDLCADSDNIYACGVSRGNDVLLMKISKGGTHQWTRIWEKEGDQWVNRIVFDGTYLYTIGYSGFLG